MRKFCVTALLLAALSAHGAAIKTGKERLRELVVIPELNININFAHGQSRADFLEDYRVPDEIAKLRKEIKEHPDDAERLLKLGGLVDRRDETNNGTEYFELAEKAARKVSAIRPRDGLALTYLGEALVRLEKYDEAENVFRKATVVSSNEWKCWIGLGDMLDYEAYHGLLPKDYFKKTSQTWDALFSLIADYKPPPDVLVRSTANRKESERCFERAISLAPKEPDVYLARADCAQGFAVEDWLIQFYREGKPPDAKQYFELNYPAGQVQYLEQAGRLCPDDYRIIGYAAWQDFLTAAMRMAQQNPAETNPPLGHLPEKTQAFVHEAIAHLERLSQSADAVGAAGALQYLGVLKLSSKDFAGAKADFRRSVKLDPANDSAWALLMAVVKDNGSPDELVEVCQELLNNKNSVQNHLLLAKALIAQKKFREAEAQLKLAAQLEPDNVLTRLISSAVALKQSADEDYLSSASTQMTDASELLKKLPDDDRKQQLERVYVLDGAIVYALSDEPAVARDWIKRFLVSYPDDQAAKDILGAIE